MRARALALSRGDSGNKDPYWPAPLIAAAAAATRPSAVVSSPRATHAGVYLSFMASMASGVGAGTDSHIYASARAEIARLNGLLQ